jgi:hypothetical protein
MFTVGPCPFRAYISKRDRIRSGQLRVTVAAGARKQEDSSKLEEYSEQAKSLRSAEEYKKSACKDLMCALKTFCVL